MSGRRLIDMHLNGGTYNLGHRNPEVVQAISEAMDYFDVGNHHFPSVARTALAQRLVQSAPASITKVAFGSGGGEAIDIAIKSARHAARAARSCRSSRLTTGTPGWRWPPGTIGSRRSSCPTAPTSSSRCRSAISTRWSRRSRVMMWPPSSWRRFLRHTDSRCRHRDTSSQSRTLPSGTGRSTSPTRSRPA